VDGAVDTLHVADGKAISTTELLFELCIAAPDAIRGPLIVVKEELIPDSIPLPGGTKD